MRPEEFLMSAGRFLEASAAHPMQCIANAGTAFAVLALPAYGEILGPRPGTNPPASSP
jgi:hypothetical protein